MPWEQQALNDEQQSEADGGGRLGLCIVSTFSNGRNPTHQHCAKPLRPVRLRLMLGAAVSVSNIWVFLFYGFCSVIALLSDRNCAFPSPPCSAVILHP